MKVYTFEANGFYEFYDLRKAKKKAIEIAKMLNDEVFVTCTNKPSYKTDWFTALPNGSWVIDKKGISFDN
jgi:hypothetical protein